MNEIPTPPLVRAYNEEMPKHTAHQTATDPIGAVWCQNCGMAIGFPPLPGMEGYRE